MVRQYGITLDNQLSVSAIEKISNIKGIYKSISGVISGSE